MDRYEIWTAGHLSRRRADALGCEDLRLLPDGTSQLTFVATDQAALYGLLTRLRDAGLELLSVERTLATAHSMTGRLRVRPGPGRELNEIQDNDGRDGGTEHV